MKVKGKRRKGGERWSEREMKVGRAGEREVRGKGADRSKGARGGET